jgi:predicted nucleic acid-binding Zn ribbon protein
MQTLSSTLLPQSPLGRVQSIWEAAVGADIAAHASPVAERDGTLTVRCSGAVWAAELEMRAGELAELLNAQLQPHASISRLRFVSR